MAMEPNGPQASEKLKKALVPNKKATPRLRRTASTLSLMPPPDSPSDEVNKNVKYHVAKKIICQGKRSPSPLFDAETSEPALC